MNSELHPIRQLLAALAAAALCVGTASAGTHTWNGEGFFGNRTLRWSDPFNWNELAAPTNGEPNLVLIFPAGTNTFVTNDIAGLVIDQLQITGTNYVLHGQGAGTAITLLGSAPFFLDLNISGATNSIAASLPVVLSNTVSLSIPTNKTFTIKSAISGSGGLDKGGPGTLTMQTAGINNSFTGATAVRNGLLLLNNGNALAIPGQLTIGEAGGSNPCEVRYANSFAIADATTVTVYTNGEFNLFGYNDTINSLNIYGGRVSTDIGTLSLNGGITATGFGQLYGLVSFGNATRTVNCVDGGLYVDATFTSPFSNIGLNKTGAGYLSLNATNQLDGVFSVAAGTLFVNHSGALGTTAGVTVVSNGASIYVGNFINVGGESLTVQGNGDPAGNYGALAFATAANWAGNITLPADTLCKVLSSSGTSTINGTVSGAGRLIKDGVGTLYLGGSSFNNNTGGLEAWNGTVYLSKPLNQYAVVNSLIIGATNGASGSATVALLNGNQISDFADVEIRSSGILDTLGNYETIGSLTGAGQLKLGGGYLSVGSDNTSTLFSGPITGAGTTNLVKVGTGTLTLSGVSAVSGRTLVDEGTLRVDGSMVSSPFTVISGGTLGGDGTVGSVTVEAGGTLSPGASPGQLGISGSLTMNLGSTYAVELNGFQAGTTYDQVVASGAISLGNATLSLSVGIPTAVSNYWMIVSKSGAGAISGTFNGLPENSVIVAGNRKFRITYAGGNGNDVFLTQDNSVPQIQTMNAPANSPEGSALALTGTYLEPDNGDTVKMVVNWGDGFTTTNNVSGGVFNLSHTYTDDNPTGSPQDQYTISAFLFDSNGGVGPTLGRLPVITNVPPSYSLPAFVSLLPGQPLNTALTITDPGTDTFQAYVNYGAGGGAPQVPVAGNQLNLSYSYPSNGIYNAAVLVRDDDLGETTQFFTVVVGMQLSISDAPPANVRLTWPNLGQPLTLQSATNLAAPVWVNVPGTPVLSGDRYSIQLPKTNPISLYRLKFP